MHNNFLVGKFTFPLHTSVSSPLLNIPVTANGVITGGIYRTDGRTDGGVINVVVWLSFSFPVVYGTSGTAEISVGDWLCGNGIDGACV